MQQNIKSLEMLYLMNVILYVNNGDCRLFPFISKNCLNACNAMKTNPWLNWSKEPINDIKQIMKLFPRLQTLRIDDYSLIKVENEKEIQEVNAIDLIYLKGVTKHMFGPSIQNKLTISFNTNIQTNTMKLYVNTSIDNVYYLNVSSKLLFIQLRPLESIDIKLIQTLNSFNEAIKIRLDLSYSHLNQLQEIYNMCNSNITVVFHNDGCEYIVNNETIEYCIDPFKSNLTMNMYEKYCLPSILIISTLKQGLNDLTAFHHVQKIILPDQSISPNTIVNLPISTEIINSQITSYNAINDLIILNWKELHMINTIYHNENINIPYPQIKYEKSLKKINQNNWLDVSIGLLSLFCCCYLVVPLLTLLRSIIIYGFDFEYITDTNYIQMIIYYHIYVIYFTLVMIQQGINVLRSKPPTLITDIILITCTTIYLNISTLIYGYSLLLYTPITWFPMTIMLVIPILIMYHFFIMREKLKITHFQTLKHVRILSRNIISTKWILFFTDRIDNNMSGYKLLSLFIFEAHVIFGLVESAITLFGVVSYICWICFGIGFSIAPAIAISKVCMMFFEEIKRKFFS